MGRGWTGANLWPQFEHATSRSFRPSNATALVPALGLAGWLVPENDLSAGAPLARSVSPARGMRRRHVLSACGSASACRRFTPHALQPLQKTMHYASAPRPTARGGNSKRVQLAGDGPCGGNSLRPKLLDCRPQCLGSLVSVPGIRLRPAPSVSRNAQIGNGPVNGREVPPSTTHCWNLAPVKFPHYGAKRDDASVSQLRQNDGQVDGTFPRPLILCGGTQVSLPTSSD
jgi:hypothetical protein